MKPSRTRSQVRVGWNQETYFYSHEKEAVYHIFMLLSIKMIYQPTKVIKENICSLCDMFIDTFSSVKASSKDVLKNKLLDNLIKRLRDLKTIISKTNELDGKKACEKLHEFLLKMDNLNTLFGFGFKGGTKGIGNPEKESVVPQVYKKNVCSNQLISETKAEPEKKIRKKFKKVQKTVYNGSKDENQTEDKLI